MSKAFCPLCGLKTIFFTGAYITSVYFLGSSQLVADLLKDQKLGGGNIAKPSASALRKAGKALLDEEDRIVELISKFFPTEASAEQVEDHQARFFELKRGLFNEAVKWLDGSALAPLFAERSLQFLFQFSHVVDELLFGAARFS